ncbi:MAG: VWA domain-containing protein [Acidobacteriia bacterium]|nr:VWA domain-containing protein [Terriglobia bacterium]
MKLMRLSALVVILLLLGSFCLAQTTPAQQPPAPPSATDKPGDDGPVGTIRKRVDQVNVIFTVTDKHGRFVKDLTQDKFTILDNNKPPQKIDNFEAQTNLPLRVGLLIDASNSIRDRFLFEQQAASEFLQSVVRPQSDQAFVLAFDELPTITQDFTSDLDKLTKGVRVIRPGGGTAMWDAVFYACRDKLLKERNTGPVRRAIILVSDGDDNQSRVLRQEAIEMAQRAEVIIYAVSTNLNNIKDSGDHNLQILADATGGRAFFPFKLHDLADAFNEIQGELRSQYSVSYKPESLVANGQYRSISIAADDKKLKVRARKGYFAPKE